MKKFLFTLFLIPLFLFCGCIEKQQKTLERLTEETAAQINENTNFELKFLENVAEKDLSFLVPDYDWFGADAYHNSGYQEGDIHYVHYLVTAYPDYADGGSVVTQIICTDPSVTFFGGYTVENCDALFLYLSGEGFEIINSGDSPSSLTSATKDKISITYDSISKKITFTYEVSNREGIVF